MEWKEASIDAVALALQMDQQYLVNEALRGRCGIGQFRLRDRFSAAKLQTEEVSFKKINYNPESIVEQIKENRYVQQNEVDENHDNNEDKDENPTEPPKTQTAMACETYKNGKVVHVPQMQCFMVEGMTGEKYAVNLFPKEKCQCPSNSTCYHILAVRLSLNIPIQDQKRTCNMTVLRRNARCRSEKKMSRKHQNVTDNKTATPAPDSKAVKRSAEQTPVSFSVSKKRCMGDLTPIEETLSLDKEDSESNGARNSDAAPKLARKSLNFNNDTSSTPDKSSISSKTTSLVLTYLNSMSTDDIMSLYNALEGFNLQIPKDIVTVQVLSATDPVLSLYKDVLNLHETDIDELSSHLLQKVKQSSIKTFESRTAELLLMAAVLSFAFHNQLKPLEVTESLQLKPHHMAEFNFDEKNVSPVKNFKVFNNDVGREDLKTLESPKWLNDKVIHAYLGLLMRERNDKQSNQTFVLPSFLGQKWENNDFKSWTYKKVDLLDFSDIFMPVCLKNHWILCHVSNGRKEITVYDSIGSTDYSRVKNHWINFMRARGDMTKHENDDWEYRTGLCSRQTDGHSCGVFVLMIAEAILKAVPPVIMRQIHCQPYRMYVKGRLIQNSTANDEIVCEMPFCGEPTSKKTRWIQCDHCNRWIHLRCSGHSIIKNLKKAYKCLMCL